MSENTTPVEPVATPGPRRWRPLLLGLAVALPVTAAGLFAWLEYEPQGERQLVEANATGQKAERSADPRQKGTFIGQREAVIRCFAKAGYFHHNSLMGSRLRKIPAILPESQSRRH